MFVNTEGVVRITDEPLASAWHRIDLGYECEVSHVEIISRRHMKSIDVKVGFDMNPYSENNMLCGATGLWPTSGVSRPQLNVSCILRGRYIFLVTSSGDGGSDRFEWQRVYDVAVKGTPVQPYTHTVVGFPWADDDVWAPPQHVQPSTALYKVPLAGHFPVSAQVAMEYSTYRDYSVQEAVVYFGKGMLRGGSYRDSGYWLANDFEVASVVLDLKSAQSVAALRVLNTHNNQYMNTGIKTLMIEAGSPSAYVDVARGRPVTASHAPTHDWQPVGAPADVTDGDARTCYVLPAHENANLGRWVLIDLGEIKDVREIRLATNLTTLSDVVILLGDTVEDVVVDGPNDAFTYKQWYANATSPAVKNACSKAARRTLHASDANPVNGSDSLHHPFGPFQRGLFRMACIGAGRFVAVRLEQTHRNNVTLCAVEVMSESQSGQWTVVADEVAIPHQFRHAHDSADQRGLGAWEVVPFPSPVVTRYLRLTAKAHWKKRAGIAAVDVWSDREVAEHVIAMKKPVNVSKPGLLMELFSDYSGMYAGQSGMNGDWDAVEKRFEFDRVLSSAIVPKVEFFSDHPNNKGLDCHQAGSAMVPPCHALCDSTGVAFRVFFELPFPMTPNASIQLHPRHRNAKMGSNWISPAMEFDFTIVERTPSYMDIVATSLSPVTWGTNSSNVSALTISYNAKSFFHPGRDDSGEMDENWVGKDHVNRFLEEPRYNLFYMSLCKHSTA